MGCYDSIKFYCPNCGNKILAQSKSGDCILSVFSYLAVPKSVSFDVNRHAPFHCKCGKKWYLEPETMNTITFAIKEYKDE